MSAISAQTVLARLALQEEEERWQRQQVEKTRKIVEVENGVRKASGTWSARCTGKDTSINSAWLRIFQYGGGEEYELLVHKRTAELYGKSDCTEDDWAIGFGRSTKESLDGTTEETEAARRRRLAGKPPRKRRVFGPRNRLAPGNSAEDRLARLQKEAERRHLTAMNAGERRRPGRPPGQIRVPSQQARDSVGLRELLTQLLKKQPGTTHGISTDQLMAEALESGETINALRSKLITPNDRKRGRSASLSGLSLCDDTPGTPSTPFTPYTSFSGGFTPRDTSSRRSVASSRMSNTVMSRSATPATRRRVRGVKIEQVKKTDKKSQSTTDPSKRRRRRSSGIKSIPEVAHRCEVKGCVHGGRPVQLPNNKRKIICLKHRREMRKEQGMASESICNVKGCVRRILSWKLNSDNYGGPGPRCPRHIRPCSAVGCTKSGQRKWTKDHLGEGGYRCFAHSQEKEEKR